MKKQLFILFPFLMSFLANFSQSNVYHPFPESNAIWTQTCTAYWGATCPNGNPQLRDDNYSYHLQGDTIINGYTYHKVYRTGTSHLYCAGGSNYHVWSSYINLYSGAYRQDITQKKVYQFSFGNETVLYNFNAVVGTTLSQGCATVTSIDSILIGATYRKRFNLSSNYSIIEGVGSTSGLFGSICQFFESNCTLKCFIQNGSTLYPDTINACQIQTSVHELKKAPKYSISPNPSSGIYNIYGLINESVFEVFDVNGKSIYKKTISENSASIDLTKNNKGVYYYRIMDAKGNSTQGILALE
jgi:hypothetical protein